MKRNRRAGKWSPTGDHRVVFYHLCGTPDAEALQGREIAPHFPLDVTPFPFIILPLSLAGSPKIYSERVDLLMASFLPPTDLLFAGGERGSEMMSVRLLPRPALFVCRSSWRHEMVFISASLTSYKPATPILRQIWAVMKIPGQKR